MCWLADSVDSVPLCRRGERQRSRFQYTRQQLADRNFSPAEIDSVAYNQKLGRKKNTAKAHEELDARTHTHVRSVENRNSKQQTERATKKIWNNLEFSLADVE